MKTWNEYVEENKTLTVEQFSKKLKEAYLKLFPDAWINVRIQHMLGSSLSISFGIQNPKYHSNKIMDNDPSFHKILIQDMVDETIFNEKIEVDLLRGGALVVKPIGKSYFAFERIKCGWRKKTATPEKALQHLIKYFGKMRKVVDDNRSRIEELNIK